MNKINKVLNTTSNLKYLSRCQYYGKLVDLEYVSEALVLLFTVYTASEYFGGTTNIRVYVPTDMENKLVDELITGENYFLITAPYRINFKKQYPHRVDLLLSIFKEII